MSLRGAASCLFAAGVIAAMPRGASALDFRVGKESLRLNLTESLYVAARLDTGNSLYVGGPGCVNDRTRTACYLGDITDDNYGELLNRLNAQLAWRRFLFSVRLDSGLWANSPNPTLLAEKGDLGRRFVDGTYVADRGPVPVGVAGFYIEKIAASYIGRSVEVTLGDFYANLGRGLVLSIRKFDELGIDTTITGGKVLVHEGDFTATAIAGFTNVQNIDQTRAQWIQESNDLVTAGSLGYRIAKKATLTANVMWGTPGCPGRGDDCRRVKPIDQNYYLRPGLALDAPRLTSWLGLYAEYVRKQDQVNVLTDGTCPSCAGNALYGAADLHFGTVSLLFEGKWYDNYQPWHGAHDPFGNIVLNVPPTLERIIVQLNNNTDVVAGRVRVSKRFSQATSLFVSGQVGQTHPGPGVTDTLIDLYAGAELRWNQGRSHFFPLVEYRNEHVEMAEGALPRTEEQLVAVEWDFAQDLPRRFTLESQGLVWHRRKPLAGTVFDNDGRLIATIKDGNEWVEGQAYVSLKWASKLTISAGYEFTSNPSERDFTHDFPNGQILWNITSGTSLALFGGGNRPGLRCISGVCRVFPAFQGVRLELVVRL